MNEQAPQWLSYFWKQTERHSYEPYKERAINGANRQMLGRVLIRGPRISEIGGNVVVFRTSKEAADFRKLVSRGFLVLTSLDSNSLCYKRRSVSFRLAKCLCLFFLCSPLYHFITMWSHQRRVTMINLIWTKLIFDVIKQRDKRPSEAVALVLSQAITRLLAVCFSLEIT